MTNETQTNDFQDIEFNETAKQLLSEKVATSQREKLGALAVTMLVGLGIFLCLGAVLVLIFSFAKHLLPEDAILVLLGLFGYVAFEVLADFSRWMRSDMGVEDNTGHTSGEKPEDYAPGVPPKIIFHGK